MEHRWHSRGPLELHVALSHQGEPVLTCSTRNVSANGMLLFPRVELDLNSTVEIYFELAGKHGIRGYRVSGQIIHHGHYGTGIMFQSHRSETREAVHALLAHMGCARPRFATG